jgi:hypothetical protein
MLAIIATVGWILFDVYFCLRTTLDMSHIEWWTFLIGGVGLGLAALGGELLDRKSHNKEIDGLNGQLQDLKTGQTFQSGQMDALTQLIGQEALHKIAAELRIPITEVAKEVMEGLRATVSQNQTMREEIERLSAENSQLRERPTAGLAVGASATVRRPPLVFTVDPRVRALYQAVTSYERTVPEDIGKVKDSASTTVTKDKPKE